jgi:enamine deaminase RidA (YjgF/YER057c/UK114 family)
MTRTQISSGSKFEAEIGYSRAIVDGDWIWVSGTTGFNYQTMTISEDVTEQAEQTFHNIKAAMERAGFSMDDVVRVTYIFPNGADFEPCWPVFRRYLGEIRPAATAILAGLVDPRMKIEIEVTGKKRRGLA